MRYVIFGGGSIAPINMKALAACDGVEICAIANRTGSHAQKACRLSGVSCRIYTDWKEALEKEKPDGAVICVYNDQHREYFLECARRGISVLCEKPLANTYEECREMIAARDAHGIRSSVLQTQRYGKEIITAVDYIHRHREDLGELCAVEDNLSFEYGWERRGSWQLDHKRSGGGVVMNYGVHQLDRVLYMIRESGGLPVTKRFTGQCSMKMPGISTYSAYTMMGVTADGIPYTCACNGYSAPDINEIVLNFQKGTIRIAIRGNGIDRRGVFISDGETFTEIPLICEDGPEYEQTYFREMRAAHEYLSGVTGEAPVPMEWSAEVVRLTGIAMEDTE